MNPTGLAAAGPYQNISLLVALLFGTLGLPHVLVRFYTNPDGSSARRTTLIVLGLLSIFYLFPTAYGLVGRTFAPELAQSGRADAVVLLLPGHLIGGTAGDLLSALVVAGAFAAFLSTTSGLVVSLAGVISQDVLGGGVRGFRLAAVISAIVPLGFALMTDSLALAGRLAWCSPSPPPLSARPPAGHLVARPHRHRCHCRDGDRRRALWWRHGVRSRPGHGDPVLAGPAGGVDRARCLRRHGVRLARHQRPDSEDHDPGHDAAAHSGTAAGHRTLDAGNGRYPRERAVNGWRLRLGSPPAPRASRLRVDNGGMSPQDGSARHGARTAFPLGPGATARHRTLEPACVPQHHAG